MQLVSLLLALLLLLLLLPLLFRLLIVRRRIGLDDPLSVVGAGMASAWLKILYDGMKSFLGASRLLFTLTTTFGPQFAAVKQRALTGAGDEEFEVFGLPADGVGLLVFLYICSMLSKLSSKLSFFFFTRGEMLADRRTNPRDLLSELLLLLSSSLANC